MAKQKWAAGYRTKTDDAVKHMQREARFDLFFYFDNSTLTLL